MGGAAGNQPLLFALGVVALSSVEGMRSYVALERRHPDGKRWVEFARFATKADARVALGKLVSSGHATADELRIERIDLAH